MYAQIYENSCRRIGWTINDCLKRDGITTEQIDEWLDSPEAQALPDWAWDIINAIMNNAVDIEP